MSFCTWISTTVLFLVIVLHFCSTLLYCCIILTSGFAVLLRRDTTVFSRSYPSILALRFSGCVISLDILFHSGPSDLSHHTLFRKLISSYVFLSILCLMQVVFKNRFRQRHSTNSCNPLRTFRSSYLIYYTVYTSILESIVSLRPYRKSRIVKKSGIHVNNTCASNANPIVSMRLRPYAFVPNQSILIWKKLQ